MMVSDAAADAARYRFYADMLDAYGKNWPDELVKSLKVDPDAEPIDLPPPAEDPADMPVVLSIEISLATYEQLATRAAEVGITVEELLVATATAHDGTGA